jgi:Rha family phage regulatory protein
MASNTQLIHQAGDRLYITSLDISQRFGKRHKNVIQSIENLECSPEFSRLNFQLSEFTTERGKTYPMYEITRDGFVFLCMGFTRPQAALWKERYIAAFNAMESTLRAAPVELKPPVSPAAVYTPPRPETKPRITRAVERQIFEMFVAGQSITEIGQHLRISRTSASLVLHGKYQFGPTTGTPECSSTLIAAVAQRHLTVELARLAATQDRIAQHYLCSAHNLSLAAALDNVGQQLQRLPALALAAPQGGAQ